MDFSAGVWHIRRVYRSTLRATQIQIPLCQMQVQHASWASVADGHGHRVPAQPILSLSCHGVGLESTAADAVLQMMKKVQQASWTLRHQWARKRKGRCSLQDDSLSLSCCGARGVAGTGIIRLCSMQQAVTINGQMHHVASGGCGPVPSWGSMICERQQAQVV